MKKILLIFAVLFVSCFEVQVKPKEVNAQGFAAGRIDYGYRTEIIQGMTYGIWYVTSGTWNTGFDIEIINLTKDALEVELLKKQLKEK